MDDKKPVLDRVAYEIFLKKGYKNTNVAEISKEAGISVGAFYKYYDSKEAIFAEIYIRENEAMRAGLVERVDWNLPALLVMEEIFGYIQEKMLSNKILAEWNNPKIHERMRHYYLSEEGIAGNSFHRFLLDYIRRYLEQSGYDAEEIRKIVRVYEMMYFIDCNVKEEEFPDKTETLKVMLTYFIRGISKERKGEGI